VLLVKRHGEGWEQARQQAAHPRRKGAAEQSERRVDGPDLDPHAIRAIADQAERQQDGRRRAPAAQHQQRGEGGQHDAAGGGDKQVRAQLWRVAGIIGRHRDDDPVARAAIAQQGEGDALAGVRRLDLPPGRIISYGVIIADARPPGRAVLEDADRPNIAGRQFRLVAGAESEPSAYVLTQQAVSGGALQYVVDAQQQGEQADRRQAEPAPAGEGRARAGMALVRLRPHVPPAIPVTLARIGYWPCKRGSKPGFVASGVLASPLSTPPGSWPRPDSGGAPRELARFWRGREGGNSRAGGGDRMCR